MRYVLKQLELLPAADEPPDVTLKPADAVEALAPQLPALRAIAIEFPNPSEGRGYTQARLLRERYGFRGELRAVGHVKRDQIGFLVRCGFDAFELSAGESVEGALASLGQYSVAYAPGTPSAPALPARFARRSA